MRSVAALTFHLCASAIVLQGCAAGPVDERIVFLETEDYGCGAEPGLGCGLALAPVLERLDALDGVAGSRVSWNGHSFRIACAPGADPDRVASEAALVLGEGARRVAPQTPHDDAVDTTAGSGADARWFDSRETIAMSRYEAGVLARDFATDIAKEAELPEALRLRLQATLHADIERAFERAHAAGGGVHRLWEQLPQAWDDFEPRLEEFLTREQAANVVAILRRQLGDDR